MKLTMNRLSVLATVAAYAAAEMQQHTARGSPITAVVEKLQDMAVKSKTDAEEEAEIFQKFECYCTKTIAESGKSIESLGEKIQLTENRITELIALGKELAEKKKDAEYDKSKAESEKSELKTVRDKANKEFKAEEADLDKSVKELTEAVDTVKKIGAPPAALLQVAHLLGKKQEESTSFLSKAEPPTGGVLGVLQSTLDTYTKNLKDRRAQEAEELDTWTKLDKNKEEAIASLTSMIAQLESSIGDATKELGEKRTELEEAGKDTTDTTKLKETTEKLFAEKSKINEERKLLRSQEDAALSKAIAVLNSDAAFATFGKTKTGAHEFLIQLATVHKHMSGSHSATQSGAKMVSSILRKLGIQMHSSSLLRLASMVRTSSGNPFEKVLKEIDTMLLRIVTEGKQDKKKFDFCAEDRKNNNADKTTKEKSITSLTGSIDELNKAITTQTETLTTSKAELAENDEDQKSSTELRKRENAEYQQNIATLVKAQDVLAKGTKILQDYYDSIEQPEFFVQVSAHSSEDPPKTNDGAYKGQGGAGGVVLGLLKEITDDTKAEENAAHKAEQEAQHSFEDNMKALTDKEATLKETIEKTSADLAQSNLDKDSKVEELKATEKEKTSIEEYLASIKSGCDFIASNFDKREAARAAESKALAAGQETIKNTPAYKNAEAEKLAELGESPKE
eukprot:TRINITY_DN108656_c0_g1_i1.p1 TRINITY_DN108656_c0_g1~~TRINITY_DN108656_c0_g1_i1.p1  ORF type:complete len:681 (+),score=195.81 TRINITY_DN108656_c0_g1_i1:97-2139(+)